VEVQGNETCDGRDSETSRHQGLHQRSSGVTALAEFVGSLSSKKRWVTEDLYRVGDDRDTLRLTTGYVLIEDLWNLS